MLLLALFLSVAGLGHASVCAQEISGVLADEDVGSLLQRGNLMRVNISSERQTKPEKRLMKTAVPKHCGPAGITSAAVGYYVLILLSSLWAALSGTDGGLGSEGSESEGRGSCSQVCQVLQGCVWQLLLGLATGYAGKENPQAAALVACLVSGAALGAYQAASQTSFLFTLLLPFFKNGVVLLQRIWHEGGRGTKAGVERQRHGAYETVQGHPHQHVACALLRIEAHRSQNFSLHEAGLFLMLCGYASLSLPLASVRN